MLDMSDVVPGRQPMRTCATNGYRSRRRRGRVCVVDGLEEPSCMVFLCEPCGLCIECPEGRVTRYRRGSCGVTRGASLDCTEWDAKPWRGGSGGLAPAP